MKNPNTFRKIVIKSSVNLIESESFQSAVNSGYKIGEGYAFRLGYSLSAMEQLLHKLDLTEEQLLILHETYANRHFIVA
jgi:hypothetical protein